MAATTSLKLPEHLKDKVANLAGTAAQTPHAYMVEAISEKVARDEKRRAFDNSAEKSRAEFMRTGVAYRHEDVVKYVMKLARGEKARKPKPISIPRSQR